MSIASILTNYRFKKSDDKRDAGLITPADIMRFDNLSYGKHKKWNLLDVYLPHKTKKKLPTIINIHGGGWVYGTKETYQFYLMSLAQRGFTVINPNYRLAPKAKFPSQLEDVDEVVNWVLNNHRDYYIDVDNLYLIGDSAGAHLTALYTSLCTNEKYQELLKIYPPKGFRPNAVLLNCGVYKFSFDSDSKPNDKLRDFLGKKEIDEKLKLVDPLKYITSQFPPVFLMSSTGDFLLDHVKPMQEVLEKNNVEHTVKIYGDDVLKPAHVFHCDIKSNISKLCNDEQCDFLKNYIR